MRKTLLLMFSMLLSSCSSDSWNFPPKFTVCDVNLEYDLDSDESTAQVRVGYCTPAEWLKK